MQSKEKSPEVNPDDNSTSEFNYKKTETLQIQKMRRWVMILAAASGVLLAICLFLLVGLILISQSESNLKRENQDLKSQLKSAQNLNVSNASYQTNSEKVSSENLDSAKLLTAADVGEGQIPDHFVGNKNAQVIVVEYEDFACSHCQASHASTNQLHDEYDDRVLFIRRAFNLGFPNSEITLAAAEAAYLVGGEEAYQKMSDLLYQDSTWTGGAVETTRASAKINGYAQEIGLDKDEFGKVLSERNQNAIMTKIDRDKEIATAAGVTGTPSRFLNGQKVSSNAESLRTAIDAALQGNT